MEISSLYWLGQTLAALPLTLWVYVGMGVPWALVALPRQEWTQRAAVLCLAFVFGPALLTAWMFVLGTLGGALDTPLLRFELILAGTIVIALPGMWWAWRKMQRIPPAKTAPAPWSPDERLLIALIVIAFAVRWLVTAYWPFLAYDALWVFGYEGRLYTLTQMIPPSVDYYPQFMPLQYAFNQLAVGGIDDHAARTVIPFLHAGSILAAYVLGRRLFSRRAGLFTAAMWALYPHVAEWARSGDLEIPLAFLFTTAAVFFLQAWEAPDTAHRRRYALIAGLVFGVAMWTKPTAGAFVWGVVLLVGVELIRTRLRVHRWYPRFETAAITGLACLPLGAAWYIRNILLGHDAIDFPHESWLALARRSGDLVGWWTLALVLLVAYLFTRPGPRPNARLTAAGLVLVLLGVLPSNPLLNPARLDPPHSYIQPLEWLALAAGLALVGGALSRFYNSHAGREVQRSVTRLSWASLLVVPYFVTWFYSYSYHPRLSFAIVPLMILPAAVILARWFPAEHVRRWGPVRRSAAALAIVLLALPGIIRAYTTAAPQMDWLWSGQYPDDHSRYSTQNPSIMLVKQALDEYVAQHGRDPVIVAPGEQRLRFFFPLARIDEFALPTRLAELEGATHYIYGAQARWRYADAGIDPLNNQVVASLAREQIMTQVLRHTDGTFRYELYELHLNDRFQPAADQGIVHLAEDDIIFGGYVRYRGDNVSSRQLIGSKIFMDHLWEVLRPLPEDYTITVELLNLEDGEIYAAWNGKPVQGEHAYYGTHLWEPGEFVIDHRVLQLAEGETIPRGRSYRVVVGFEAPDGTRLPVTINGEPAGTGYTMTSPVYYGGEG